MTVPREAGERNRLSDVSSADRPVDLAGHTPFGLPKRLGELALEPGRSNSATSQPPVPVTASRTASLQRSANRRLVAQMQGCAARTHVAWSQTDWR